MFCGYANTQAASFSAPFFTIHPIGCRHVTMPPPASDNIGRPGGSRYFLCRFCSYLLVHHRLGRTASFCFRFVRCCCWSDIAHGDCSPSPIAQKKYRCWAFNQSAVWLHNYSVPPAFRCLRSRGRRPCHARMSVSDADSSILNALFAH